ncbi:MAG: cysteine desulfurase family protein [Candidatus Eiseniibacteriota bacterium]
MPPVYLDYNATAPIRPEAVEAVARALKLSGNPSSVHVFGRAARRAVEDAREQVAALVGAAPAEIVFTGSGSAANNAGLRARGRERLIVSVIEHDSVLRAAGAGAEMIAVLPSGVVDVEALDRLLAADARPALVSVMLANNETGVIQPIAEVVAVARRHGALVQCDAVQAAGRVDIEFNTLGVDLLTLSAHKLGGPQGVGALVVSDRVELDPLVKGGGQERGRYAGTENVAGIAGFGAAAAAVAANAKTERARVAALRDRLEDSLRAKAPGLRIFGADACRVGNTTCVAMPGVASETQVMALDLAGFAVSAGAACSSGRVQASHVLKAMGVAEAVASSAIRVSLGWRTTAAEIDGFVAAWSELYRRSAAKRTSSAA